MKIQDKLNTFIKNKGLDGLLLFGPDNQTYASGVVLPFANQYPERHTALLQKANGSRHLSSSQGMGSGCNGSELGGTRTVL